MRSDRAFSAAIAAACLSSSVAWGAAPRSDPDWPCQQRLVPAITAATVWNGPSLASIGDWRQEPSVVALVDRIGPRDVGTQEGQAAIATFIRQMTGNRTRLVSLAFAGLLEETNRERADLITRIKMLAERQRKLADLVTRLAAELDALPPSTAGDAVSRRTDLEQRWTFTSRAFEEMQHTMRYACETPGQLEARLGAYARTLQQGLPKQ